MLSHKNIKNPEISDKVLLDDWVYELDEQGNVVWEWLCSAHFDEFGFDEQARNVLYRNPGNHNDWMHINSLSAIGPNKWFDAGDERFHPDNLILDSRAANIIFIVEKSSGRIVWKIGPKYDTPELKKIGWIIGQHHAHIIPRGLPGEGNLLLYDNGGYAGYGAPMPPGRYGTHEHPEGFLAGTGNGPGLP